MNKIIFQFEGETLRISSLGSDSGARETRRSMAKWVMDRKLTNGTWERDSHVFLPNDATVADAQKRFGF